MTGQDVTGRPRDEERDGSGETGRVGPVGAMVFAALALVVNVVTVRHGIGPSIWAAHLPDGPSTAVMVAIIGIGAVLGLLLTLAAGFTVAGAVATSEGVSPLWSFFGQVGLGYALGFGWTYLALDSQGVRPLGSLAGTFWWFLAGGVLMALVAARTLRGEREEADRRRSVRERGAFVTGRVLDVAEATARTVVSGNRTPCRLRIGFRDDDRRVVTSVTVEVAPTRMPRPGDDVDVWYLPGGIGAGPGEEHGIADRDVVVELPRPEVEF
ncbi:hypothetical protein [Actinoalloteichus caeruleus]|uniref:DUF3592 domain-containing protein n=1 Tax=Actinoalloteichus caeruleus DSM 43889 TaxID=1120930 RepID=A0ABT1JFD8_ACTCY|nr:hypothetical protein [Actinoalloteichus caeruleus]MCP2331128.1 hypothetical protein [Actinoalloteichus caeruleus DSM 43889]